MENPVANDTLVIYRSSAGSGKTYTLTREYLYLALRSGDPRAYRRILAVTFTNKAMQEMKDRIIRKLAEFADGDVADPLEKELIRRLGMDENQFVTSCENLLTTILHQYSHFAIITIDAFFQQIIRSFARELQISGGYRLELQQDLVYRQVVQELMNEADENAYVRNWLEDFSLSKLDSAKGWEVEKELLDFIKQLDSESFQEIEDEVREYEDDLYKRIRKTCLVHIRRFENELAVKARAAIACIDAAGLQKNNFFSGHSANFIYYAANGIYINDPNKRPTSTFKKCLESGEWFKKKPASELLPRIDALKASNFQAIAEDLHAYWTENIRDYRTSQAVYQNIYVFALSVSLLKKLSEYKQDNDLLFISDATRLIRKLVSNTDAPFIYEKVGSFFEHFLIDEFQDTSRFQWESFRPLITNSLSLGKSNLIVGDVKQSIYRWRGGDLELLQKDVEEEFRHFQPAGEHLDKNYRSRKNIINFNNALFSEIHEVLEKSFAQKIETPQLAVSESLSAVFSDVEQQFAGSENDPAGYIEGHIFSGDDTKERVYDELIDILQKLQDRNVPLRDIAILVRDNKEGKDIAEFLMRYRKMHEGSPYRFDVVSNETLYLSASAGVSAIIAALRFLDNPKDQLARAAVLFFHKQLKDDDHVDEIFLRQERSQLDMLDQLLELKKLPLYSVVEHLIPILGLEGRHWEFPYLQTLQDHVLAYMKREKGDLTGFIQYWDDSLHQESIRVVDDLDAIRILTIHKAKGLEFHSVILPFLNWEWNKSKGIRWYPLDGLSLDDTTIVPVNYSTRLDATLFSMHYEIEVYRNYLDNLNLLYVAFTRAKHDLWFMIEKGKKSSLAKISGVMIQLLRSFRLSGHFNQEINVFRYGDADFSFAEEGSKSSDTVGLKTYMTFDWQRTLKLKPVPERIRNDNRRISISIGLLAHDILSRVKYLDDIKDALDEMRFSIGLNETDFNDLRNKLRMAFSNTAVKSWFDPSWQVRNEQAIFARGEEYRPDRIIHRNNETLIIDYKTGRPKKADRTQMLTYLKLVRDLYPGIIEGRILYLEDLEIIEVK